jgi:sulfatase modifying factor 1
MKRPHANARASSTGARAHASAGPTRRVGSFERTNAAQYAASWVTLMACLLALDACKASRRKPNRSDAGVVSSDAAQFGPPASEPIPQPGMAWIPGGALVAGTKPDSLPRAPDAEMPGEQVILKGYYIDVFAYPNEEGAIRLTNVDQAQASRLCRAQDKRLCSELEWERACKGPDNWVYEYGDRYNAERCGTGTEARNLPNGLRVGCSSGFGVRDMHGGAWEWTSSPWGRGVGGRLVTVRGGNGQDGELIGRCANAASESPRARSSSIGFRCCAGPRNEAEVALRIERGPKLERQEPTDTATARLVLDGAPPEVAQFFGDMNAVKIQRTWVWRPTGNEKLVGVGACARSGRRTACGVLVARRTLNRCRNLAWASSGRWVPSLHVDHDARDVWLLGGDARGRFRVLLRYAWGRVHVGPPERRIPRSRRRRK